MNAREAGYQGHDKNGQGLSGAMNSLNLVASVFLKMGSEGHGRYTTNQGIDNRKMIIRMMQMNTDARQLKTRPTWKGELESFLKVIKIN